MTVELHSQVILQRSFEMIQEYMNSSKPCAFSLKKCLFYKNFSIFLDLLIFLNIFLSSIFVFFFEFCSSKSAAMFFFNWYHWLSNVRMFWRCNVFILKIVLRSFVHWTLFWYQVLVVCFCWFWINECVSINEVLCDGR